MVVYLQYHKAHFLQKLKGLITYFTRCKITIIPPRCWIFHRYKCLPFFANAFIVVPFFYPSVKSFFINFVRVFWIFFKLTSVYLMLYFFLVVWVIQYYESRPCILNSNCLFVPVSYFFQCNLFFSRNIMSKYQNVFRIY